MVQEGDVLDGNDRGPVCQSPVASTFVYVVDLISASGSGMYHPLQRASQN